MLGVAEGLHVLLDKRNLLAELEAWALSSVEANLRRPHSDVQFRPSRPPGPPEIVRSELVGLRPLVARRRMWLEDVPQQQRDNVLPQRVR